MNPKILRKEFLESLEHPSGLEKLFDYLPETYFWVKNRKGQFVMLNQADAEKAGGRGEIDIIGKTDFDVFPNDLAENYAKDDQEVMATGKKIINRVELVPNEDGTIDWYATNKVPLFAKNGTIIGVAGTTRNLKKTSSMLKPYMEMSAIVDYISKNYMNPIEVRSLAKIAELSVSQFERKFKKTFQVAPMKFIINVRVKSACKSLINSTETISNIAQIPLTTCEKDCSV